jgi:hypothetical protein
MIFVNAPRVRFDVSAAIPATSVKLYRRSRPAAVPTSFATASLPSERYVSATLASLMSEISNGVVVITRRVHDGETHNVSFGRTLVKQPSPTEFCEFARDTDRQRTALLRLREG